MSSFSVRPAALRGYADTISGAATGGGLNLAHLYYARPDSYVDRWVKIDTSSGLSNLFELILSSNSTLVGNLHTTYGDIASKLSMSGVALAGSAGVYATTDEAVSARIDKLMPGVGAPVKLAEEVDGGSADDPTEPLDETPESEAPIPDPVHWIMDTAGWLSITSDVLKIASLFHIDPMASLTKALAGDYTKVAQAGNAAKALAEFEQNSAQAIMDGLDKMSHGWTGNAADQAANYFTTFANALDAHADELEQVSNKYALIVQALSEVSTLLSSLLSIVIDKLFILAVNLAAASCLQEVPVLDVVIDIAGAYNVFVTKEAVDAFVKACTAITDTAESVVLLCTGIAGLCKPGSAGTSFPSTSYSNRAQA